MTEFHADNLRDRLKGDYAAFDRAEIAGDWAAARKLRLDLMRVVDVVMRESVGVRREAEGLAVELQLYRPTRSDLTPAPLYNDYDYVTTLGGGPDWVCAAKVVRERVWVDAGHGYWQDHYATERKTACGRPVGFPVKERFGSGGWPRLHEVCPNCSRKLAEADLFVPTALELTGD